MKTAIAKSGGQALILCLLLAGAAALACLLLFNSGMLANTKTQLQNAADAGAYSGAVMLARDHNFSAYANRAMVANQVAVAQLISLQSYLEDAASTRNRMNDRVQSDQARIPVAAPAWFAIRAIPPPLAITSVNTAYRQMSATAVQSIDKLIRAFEKAQQTHHAVTADSVMLVVDDVVKQNDAQAGVSTGAFQLGTTVAQRDKWRNDYTKEHSANDNSNAANRFANVVVNAESTDEFVRDRRSTPLPRWTSATKASYCKGGRPLWTTFSFKHRGGTLLSADKKRWLALDATQGSGSYGCLYMIGKVPVPVFRSLRDPSRTHGQGGSGGAVAGRGGPYNDRNGFSGNPAAARQYGGALTGVPTPAGRRYRNGPGTTLDAQGGLQPTYRDIADFIKPANQSFELNGGQMPLTIEVERGQASVRTSSTFLGGATNIRLDPQMKGSSMRTLSSAHAFFYRPNRDSSAFTRTGWKRADNRTEMASLFNPYWQARLRDRTEGERNASQGAQ
ncbi:pilus assembly protein TadG-related protein [Massilia sp. Leaf139]|uniref:pilus assembly protein TadG-related protein n=1 Tax=Massilia sp. Leaf139 TaxID=1736272 RepID=UPI0006F1C4FE|nr:pilus assembly protein TadG-related protein [Massilia sp. Leaf139]KQQ91781.1 hypothetical protein ASF77_07570 [Massilia sp. Leaf139]